MAPDLIRLEWPSPHSRLCLDELTEPNTPLETDAHHDSYTPNAIHTPLPSTVANGIPLLGLNSYQWKPGGVGEHVAMAWVRILWRAFWYFGFFATLCNSYGSWLYR